MMFTQKYFPLKTQFGGRVLIKYPEHVMQLSDRINFNEGETLPDLIDSAHHSIPPSLCELP